MPINPNSGISALNIITPSSSIQQSLTTGQQINNAADDPAGLAVVTELTKQINTQDIAVRNANDGISLLQTADGASASISNYLTRMNELALQAQNGTYNASQRAILNLEFQQNLQGLNDIAGNTEFNGINLLNADNNDLSVALGESNANLSLPNQTSAGLGLDGIDILNSGTAATALESIGSALENLNSQRAQFGAEINGLNSAVANLQEQNINTQSNRSQILDTDFAKAISQQVRENILQDSAIAMQAQTNQSRASVLQLLNS